jgi:hypothetical protein
MRLFIIDYLWLFYALVNLTFFYFSLISYYIDYNRKLSKQLSTKLKFAVHTSSRQHNILYLGLDIGPLILHTNSRQGKNAPQILDSNSRQKKNLGY